MTINSKLLLLRTKVRNNSKVIIDHIIQSQIISKNNQANRNDGKEVCIFCGSLEQITKEHVIPRWTFEKCTEKYFITDVNGRRQTYNRTTVPACANCNNDLLGCLENYVTDLFKATDLSKSPFSNNEIQNIIRWLEIIEYKFQVLEVRRKFISSKSNGYIPYLTDFPISIIREKKGSSIKVVSEIRRSQKQITVKSKSRNTNSLVVFKTKNTSFYFFHNMNEFIFLELPRYKIALFYFFNKSFENEFDAYNTAMKIITDVYDS